MELMVVVAIIAILLMLLIPNIRNVREKAWSSHCQNNLRQYGIAMNQYMFTVLSGSSAGSSYGIAVAEQEYTGGIAVRGAASDAGNIGPPVFGNIVGYLPRDVTNIQSLSDGQASVRVCPAVIQRIKKDGNFFDPESSNFKGNNEQQDEDGDIIVTADFEDDGSTSNNLVLSAYFSTYAINSKQDGQVKTNIPENVIAYIDWNARDGWGATLISDPNNPNPVWMFNGTNSQGVAVVQGTPKWTTAWWLTEVGFHHRLGNEYGANYVAMDGHVGWVSTNTISEASFTQGL